MQPARLLPCCRTTRRKTCAPPRSGFPSGSSCARTDWLSLSDHALTGIYLVPGAGPTALPGKILPSSSALHNHQLSAEAWIHRRKELANARQPVDGVGVGPGECFRQPPHRRLAARERCPAGRLAAATAL